MIINRALLRGRDVRAALAGEQPIHPVSHPPIQIVCCYCVPPHVMRAGVEPASHGACPLAVATWMAEMDAEPPL